MSAPRSRSHVVLVRVTFDKPVSRREAATIFADNVHGEFYPGELARGGGPGLMRIRSARPGPVK